VKGSDGTRAWKRGRRRGGDGERDEMFGSRRAKNTSQTIFTISHFVARRAACADDYDITRGCDGTS